MASMAKKIEIDDLLSPRLTQAQQQAIADAEAKPVKLTEAAVLTAAQERTGLSDFGPDDFRLRLGRLIHEWNADKDMFALHRGWLLKEAQRHATNRLLIQDVLKRHPEIHEERVERPIIVVGLPRSGTTHLLNLLGADSRLRSTPLWEANEPLPIPGEQLAPGGVDPRYARWAAFWETQKSSLMAAMHPMEPDHLHEDLELMCPDFASYKFEWMSRVPQWRDYYCGTDQTPHYEYMKTMFKILQWRAGGERRRWVVKCPQHLEQLKVLRRVFPDATVAITYRDPVEVIQSAVTMVGYSERMRYPAIDAEGLLDYWTDRVERLLRACVRDRSVWPEAQSVDVPFDAFMSDQMGMVRRVQSKAGLAQSEAAERELNAFVAGHPRGKFGQVSYNLKRDFGIDPDKLRERFAFYFEAFPFLGGAQGVAVNGLS
jgi:hypothetical protein